MHKKWRQFEYISCMKDDICIITKNFKNEYELLSCDINPHTLPPLLPSLANMFSMHIFWGTVEALLLSTIILCFYWEKSSAGPWP